LVADEQATILLDSIYSSQVVVVSGIQTGSSLPELFVSNENIENWIEIDAPAGVEAADAVYLYDAAYHSAAGRWVAIGYNSTGPADNNCVVLSSDDVSDPVAWVQRAIPAKGVNKPGRCVIYDTVTDAMFGGGDSGLLMYSAEGVNWYPAFLPASLNGNSVTKFARAPNGGGGTTPRLYAVFSDTKNVAYSANLATQPLSTTWIDLGAMTTTGTGMSSCTSGNGLVYIANNNATAEVGYIIQGGTTYTKIGDLTMDVSDMVYGNGRLVVISANGRIQYADAPDETTFGNWSAVSSAIDGVGTRDLAKIEYDGGGDERIGYGFIATLSASGAPGDYLVYTSPDAVTWTLRGTQASTADALGIGTKQPQQDLSGTGGATVTLSGYSYYEVATGGIAPNVKFTVKTDGTMTKARGPTTPIQINPLTDWIIPNFAADSLYEVRVTNVVWLVGGADPDWLNSPGADGTWFDLSADRTWSVRNKTVRFDIEIRYNGGATLASGTYVLGSSRDYYPRDFNNFK
jgi:hypothetical protein